MNHFVVLEDILEEDHTESNDKNFISDNDNAMLIYTSGTTGNPKGVVLTMNNVISQTECMIKPWAWTEQVLKHFKNHSQIKNYIKITFQDTILHVLPLHHTHGIVNCLLCPLQVGASIVMLPNFDPSLVFKHLLNKTNSNVNVFMAVPTIYAKLLEYLKQNKENESKLKETLIKNIRLMVSGSAALPQPLFESWRDLTGHTLLERYGMTEIGMALTNPLEVPFRKPGYVGHPFPGVQARIVQDDKVLVQGDHVSTQVFTSDECVGDLQIKGPNVFKCYYNRPEATEKEFTQDGWFKTGDTGQFDEKSFKILGRSSVDIIK